jgi:hypothetical protein
MEKKDDEKRKTKWNEWRVNWNLNQNNINWKFENSIKLWISLINPIKSLIEKLISMRLNWT